MTDYDHTKKAGNRGDVWKHFALLTVVDGLIDRQGLGHTFRYRETHAGAGSFMLGAAGEWRQGLGEILPVRGPLRRHPYFELVGDRVDVGSLCRGSWRLVLARFDTRGVRCRMRLTDTSDTVSHQVWYELERRYLPPTVEFLHSDGFADLEHDAGSDLTLVDPPYHPTQRDWREGRGAAALLAERGENYLLWYPVFWSTNPQELVAAAGVPGYEIRWAPLGQRASRRPKGCGLVAGGAAGEILEAASGDLESLAALFGGELAVRRP